MCRLGDPPSSGPGVALPALDRQRGGRYLPRAPRAQVRQLPQHHPGRSARGVDPGGRRGGPLGPLPTAGPGAGHRVRHRRFALQRTGAASGRLPATATVPLLIDLDSFAGSADPTRPAPRAETRPTVVPTSCSSARCLRTRASTTWSRRWPRTAGSTTPRARLRLVGGPSARIPKAVERSPTSSASRCGEFAGSVSHEELIAYYAAADVFVCLSNHEGFCVPLLEAMYHRSPSSPTPTPRSPRPSPPPAWSSPTRTGPGRRRHPSGGHRSEPSGGSWPGRRRNGWRGSPCLG